MVAPVELDELQHDELGGRLKLGPNRPLNQNLASESSTQPPVDAQLDEARWLTSTQVVAKQLADSLWQQLAFARLVQESGHRGIDHIIRAASESHAQLTGWYRELREYYDAILDATVSIDASTDVNKPTLEKVRQKIHKKINLQSKHFVPPRPFVDSKFADKSEQEAMAIAHEKLTRHCIEFANNFVAFLTHLQKKNVVGSIEAGKTTCKFSYHSQVWKLKSGRTERQTKTTYDPETRNSNHPIFYIDKYEVTKTKVSGHEGQTIHHVRSPMLREVGAEQFPVPIRFQKLLDSTPAWLKPTLRVLEGDLFRANTVVQDVFDQTVVDTKHVSHYKSCPGILFGEFVIAGWGGDEIDIEQQRRTQVRQGQERSQSRRMARQLHVGAFALAFVACSSMAFSFAAPVTLSIVAITLGVVATLTASQAGYYLLRSIGSRSTSHEVQYMLIAGGVMFASLAIVYAAVQMSIVGLAIALLLALATIAGCASVSDHPILKEFFGIDGRTI